MKNPLSIQAAGSYESLALYDSTPPVHCVEYLERRFDSQRSERRSGLVAAGCTLGLYAFGVLDPLWTVALVACGFRPS